MEGNLITKDLRKKAHHHKQTCRNCGGVRRLARLPKEAAEVPEGYFSIQGCVPLRSVGSKPKAELPSLQHQKQKRNPNNIWL